MSRAPIVLTATVAGVAAVLGFHAHTPARPALAVASSGAGSGSSSSNASASSSTSGTGTTTATGAAVATPYGNAQVRVTISNGKITNIQALQLQDGNPKSVAISGYAEPILRQSALAKQSAAIDAVSGATFTSQSYAASLQSALDKAGFKAANGSRASTNAPQGSAEGGDDGGFWGP